MHLHQTLFAVYLVTLSQSLSFQPEMDDHSTNPVGQTAYYQLKHKSLSKKTRFHRFKIIRKTLNFFPHKRVINMNWSLNYTSLHIPVGLRFFMILIMLIALWFENQITKFHVDKSKAFTIVMEKSKSTRFKTKHTHNEPHSRSVNHDD